MQPIEVMEKDIATVVERLRRGEREWGGVQFDMSTWSKQTACGTACCLWGSAYLDVHKQSTDRGPCSEWVNTPYRKGLAFIFGMSRATPEQVVRLYDALQPDGTWEDLQIDDCLDGSEYKIPSGAHVTAPALTESGSVYVEQGATFTAPLLNRHRT